MTKKDYYLLHIASCSSTYGILFINEIIIVDCVICIFSAIQLNYVKLNQERLSLLKTDLITIMSLSFC